MNLRIATARRAAALAAFREQEREERCPKCGRRLEWRQLTRTSWACEATYYDRESRELVCGDCAGMPRKVGEALQEIDRKRGERADWPGADRMRNAAREAEGLCYYCGRSLENHPTPGDCLGAAEVEHGI